MGGIWNYFTNPAHQLCDLQTALQHITSELVENQDLVTVIKTSSQIAQNQRLKILLGFESLYPIADEIHLSEMYELGFRHAMLTWNEENQYATGAKGDPTRGLTDAGRKMVERMEQLHMVLDVSHANEKTFSDILSIASRPVIASHSNAWEVYPHYRNLTAKQIRMIADTGGLIGVTTVKYFTDRNQPTVARLVDHIDYLKQVVGIDHIMIGFDFMDYLIDDGHNANLEECPTPAQTDTILAELERRKYTSTEIEKIASLNLLGFLEKYI